MGSLSSAEPPESETVLQSKQGQRTQAGGWHPGPPRHRQQETEKKEENVLVLKGKVRGNPCSLSAAWVPPRNHSSFAFIVLFLSLSLLVPPAGS